MVEADEHVRVAEECGTSSLLMFWGRIRSSSSLRKGRRGSYMGVEDNFCRTM